MDRNETIALLNSNIGNFTSESATRFIVEYLSDKNVSLTKINSFIQEIVSNPLMQFSGIFSKCLEHSIKYYIEHHHINSLLKDNKTILYF